MAPTELLSQPRRSFLRHALHTVGALGTGVCMPAWSAQPPSGGRIRVTVAVAHPHSMAHLPLLLAQSLGYFEVEGLQVELAIELGDDLQPVRGAVSLDLTARDVQAGAGGGRMHAICDARL